MCDTRHTITTQQSRRQKYEWTFIFDSLFRAIFQRQNKNKTIINKEKPILEKFRLHWLILKMFCCKLQFFLQIDRNIEPRRSWNAIM